MNKFYNTIIAILPESILIIVQRLSFLKLNIAKILLLKIAVDLSLQNLQTTVHSLVILHNFADLII